MLLRIALPFANPGPQDKGKPRARIAFWTIRIPYITFTLAFGAALLSLPWLGFWDNNYLLYRFPQLRPLVSNSFLKGAVLGLGIANILIGIQEIAHIKEPSKGNSR